MGELTCLPRIGETSIKSYNIFDYALYEEARNKNSNLYKKLKEIRGDGYSGRVTIYIEEPKRTISKIGIYKGFFAEGDPVPSGTRYIEVEI